MAGWLGGEFGWRGGSRTQLEIYLERVARVSASSSHSAVGFAEASNAEVTGSNLRDKRVRFWFAKFASSNPTWALLVFETHNFRTGRTNDIWQLHVVASSNPAWVACFGTP